MPPRLRAHDTYSRGAPTTARRRRVGLDYSSGRRLQQRAWRAHALVQGEKTRGGYTGWLLGSTRSPVATYEADMTPSLLAVRLRARLDALAA